MRFQLGGAGKFVKIFEIGAANFIYFQKFPPLGRKFVKIYLPTHIWVGTGYFEKVRTKNSSENLGSGRHQDQDHHEMAPMVVATIGAGESATEISSPLDTR
jgi:hypothetical protein